MQGLYQACGGYFHHCGERNWGQGDLKELSHSTQLAVGKSEFKLCQPGSQTNSLLCRDFFFPLMNKNDELVALVRMRENFHSQILLMVM